MEGRLADEQLQDLYTWVDKVPLSRPKRNIARDFSDAVLFAEIIKHYHPKIVEMHNYSPANGLKQKVYNWETLRTKTLKKLRFQLSPEEINAVAACKPNAIEHLLVRLKSKLAAYSAGKPRSVGRASDAQEEGASRGSAPLERSWDDARSALRGSIASLPSQSDPANNMQALLDDKDQTIMEMQDTISILELKVKKLEQLLQLKDNKIAALQHQL